MSILTGIGDLVDDWLKTNPKGQRPYYRHQSAANELTRRAEPITGTRDFLDASYTRIHNNWLDAIDAGYTNPSRENWRWKRHLTLAPANTSPELRLERSIVNACGGNWSNQMPTASGLIGPATDKRAAVDLVYREDSTTYSLIELKVGSDNPLFAAIEILCYGLLFIWSKDNQEKLGYDAKTQPILAATNVELSVLAPEDYYHDYDLTSLNSTLNSELAEFADRVNVNLSFEFDQLGGEYGPDSTSERIRSAVSNRCPIWKTPGRRV